MDYENASELARFLTPQYCTHALQEALVDELGVEAPISDRQPGVFLSVPRPSYSATVACKAKVGANDINAKGVNERCFLAGGGRCPEGLETIDLPMKEIIPLLR